MTEEKPSWRCFFCDEVFTDPKDAVRHFGAAEECTPACKLMSHQQKVIDYVRYLETTIRHYIAARHEESHPLMKAVWDIEDKLAREVVQAEERGYQKGVRDMKAQGLCPEPEKHNV